MAKQAVALAQKKVQLNCWMSPEAKQTLDEFALNEDRRSGNLGGLLLEWVLPMLIRAGDSIRLKRTPSITFTSRLSEETQHQLFMALEIILRDAPSTQIEAVAEYLNRVAGKYGKEKKN